MYSTVISNAEVTALADNDMVVSRASITIAYHGPAIDAGEMDLEDFASSLLSLGKLFSDVHEIINKDDISLKKRIIATRQGSLQVYLSVVQPVMDAISEAMKSSDGTLSAEKLFALIFGPSGLLCVLKILKGRKPDRILIADQDGKIELEGDIRRMLRDHNIQSILGQPRIRRRVSGFLGPLAKDGCDRISAKSQEIHINDSITSKEARESRMFDAMPYEEFVSREYVDLAVITASDKGYKWRFSLGSRTIQASISDDAFMADVKKSGHFLIGARIQCVLECYMTPPRGHMVYEVTRVIRHYEPEDRIRHRDMMLMIGEDDTGEYWALTDNNDERVYTFRKDGHYQLWMTSPIHERPTIVAKIYCLGNRFGVTPAAGVKTIGLNHGDKYDDIEHAIASIIFAIQKARLKDEIDP